jgi:hypothetical protein
MSHYDRTSLKDLALCLAGYRTPFETPSLGDFHVVRDIMGYRMGLPDSTRQNGPAPTISLLRQLRLAADEAFDLNIISVGAEAFDDDDYRKIDAALAFFRDLLAPHNIAVRAIYHSFISSADADGYDHISDLDEAEDLTHQFSAPYLGMDVFVTRTANVPMVDAAYEGQTNVAAPYDGPENKDRNGPMTGVVLGIDPLTSQFALMLAWGVCRYLGATSDDDRDNLMFAPGDPGTALTAEQVNTIRAHGFLAVGCSYHYDFRWSGGL